MEIGEVGQVGEDRLQVSDRRARRSVRGRMGRYTSRLAVALAHLNHLPLLLPISSPTQAPMRRDSLCPRSLSSPLCQVPVSQEIGLMPLPQVSTRHKARRSCRATRQRDGPQDDVVH